MAALRLDAIVYSLVPSQHNWSYSRCGAHFTLEHGSSLGHVRKLFAIRIPP